MKEKRKLSGGYFLNEIDMFRRLGLKDKKRFMKKYTAMYERGTLSKKQYQLLASITNKHEENRKNYLEKKRYENKLAWMARKQAREQK